MVQRLHKWHTGDRYKGDEEDPPRSAAPIQAPKKSTQSKPRDWWKNASVKFKELHKHASEANKVVLPNDYRRLAYKFSSDEDKEIGNVIGTGAFAAIVVSSSPRYLLLFAHSLEFLESAVGSNAQNKVTRRSRQPSNCRIRSGRRESISERLRPTRQT